MHEATRLREVLALLLALGLNACAAAGLPPEPAGLDGFTQLQRNGPSALSLPELQGLLAAELQRLGVDPARVASRAPQGNTAVFDLAALPQGDPDGAGPLPPVAYALSWTERLTGDYDQNGEVNIADLTTMAANLGAPVAYDDPLLHNGIAWWPQGNPQEGGGAAGDKPAPGSGAANWRLARIDGDANGEVNLSDITPLGVHFGERLDGYCVFRRRQGETGFELLPNASDPQLPYTVRRTEAGAAGQSSHWPLRYSFTDTALPDASAEYEYRVAPYDAQSALQGPLSVTGAEENPDVQASFTVSASQGAPPLTVQFDASASRALVGEILVYEWDFDNNGMPDYTSTTSPLASFTYPVRGSFLAVLRVGTGKASAAAGLRIAVGAAPTPVVQVTPASVEVPVTITFDASGSTGSGAISRYEWDRDGDGDFEHDTGPVPYIQLQYTAVGAATLGLRVTDDVGVTASKSLNLSFVDNYDEQEPNDLAVQANLLAGLAAGESAGPLTASLGPDGYDGDSVDWYKLTLASGGLLTLTLDAAQPAPLYLTLLDKQGQTELGSNRNGDAHKQLLRGVRNAGTYYLRCERGLGAPGGALDYSLSASFAPLTYAETEDNSSFAAASDLGSFAGSVFPGYWGRLGVPAADSVDWWKVSFPVSTNCTVRLSFEHQDADLDLRVYAADGLTLLGESVSVTDNESVALAAASGVVYICCSQHAGDSANYELGFTTP